MKHHIKFLEWVAKFYEWQLHNCKEAYDYVRPRVLDPIVLREFGIGLAGSYNELSMHVKSKYPTKLPLAEELDLVRSKDGQHYDFFKERIMFPIHDEHGNMVGFSGRSFLPGAKVKYLNSSASPVFDKSELVFNLHRARDHIKTKGFVYLVEGFFDATTLHAYGYQNVVASMGTAFRPSHADVLRTYCNKVVVAYDGDRAGRESTYEVIKILKSKGFHIKVAQFPEGFDPDSYAFKHGHLDPLTKPINMHTYIFEQAFETLKAKPSAMQLNYGLYELPKVLKYTTRATYEPLFVRVADYLGINFQAYKDDLSHIHGFKFDDSKPISREIERRGGADTLTIHVYEGDTLLFSTDSTVLAHYYKWVKRILDSDHERTLEIAEYAKALYELDDFRVPVFNLVEYVCQYYSDIKDTPPEEALQAFYKHYVDSDVIEDD